MLTPLDMHNKTFGKGFRGYSTDEVDEFMERVAKDFERLYQENLEYKETVDRLSHQLEQYQQMESTLRNTLIIAQETAEDVKTNARKETELMLKETEIRTQQMMNDACLKVRKVQEEYDELNKQLQVFRTKLKAMLETQMELLKLPEAQEPPA